MNVGEFTYEDGILRISDNYGSMWLPCDADGAESIMTSARVAYKTPDGFMVVPYNIVRKSYELMTETDIESRLEALRLQGFTEVLSTDGITLFIKCISSRYNLFMFRYVSDELPNTHGDTQVYMTMNV